MDDIRFVSAGGCRGDPPGPNKTESKRRTVAGYYTSQHGWVALTRHDIEAPYAYNSSMVKFDPKIHHRRSIRLKEYDYSQAGAYFVTIVTYHREFLFGEIVNAQSRLNKIGEIVESEWLETSKRFYYIELGAYMVMPNHFHGILHIHETVGATRQGQTRTNPSIEPSQASNTISMDGSPLPRGIKRASLGAIIAQFKSRVTKRIWKIPVFKNKPIWQRNYHEHIIRDETDLKNKTDYIEANPLLWDQDEENPNNIT